VAGGSYDTYEASVEATMTQSSMSAVVFAERFSTSGYAVVRADQRGPVDNTASDDSAVFSVRTQWQLGSETTVRLSLREFYDDRGNGTILTRNSSLGEDAAVVLTNKFPAESAELQLAVYGQYRRFSSTFSSINGQRTSETPALDQSRNI
jgi:hypothetical protein